ncbi:putative nuclease HARBI1 [Dreissena polymorpha]|uniref:putative nuclease HARBI1 n=1 Tax=Dreissena polymorpha TaxID=45954 RepID=UPI002263B280|nr:putative nuclease HARBI1 [Dreissena polymorpha]
MADVLFFRHRRQRRFRRIDLQTNGLDDDELRRRYRFSAQSLDRLVDLLDPILRRQTRRNRSLSTRQQILITLRFLATGNFLQVIGDTFGVDIATVSRVITAVVDAFFGLKDRFIKFPTSDEDRCRATNDFFRVREFPSVIGCIDGTHIRLLSPGQPDEAAYVNRKHYHSINVHATCDRDGNFTSMNACWPGSCHDAHVFRMSNVGRHLDANHQDPGRGWLLGDSGYPCRPFLMTPILHPRNEAEERYNQAHISTRNIIERCFGVWKRTFHILHVEIRMKPAKVTRIVLACAVLHNMRRMWGEPNPDVQDDLDEQPDVQNFDGPMDGRGVRNRLIEQYFV